MVRQWFKHRVIITNTPNNISHFHIRQPAAIDDLRRWTSTEAIGDITVTPDCMARVVSSMHHSSAVSQSHSLALSSIHGTTLSASSSAGDATDNIDATAMFAAVASSTAAAADVTDDMPLDHRLPSPEEQCHLIAMRYVFAIRVTNFPLRISVLKNRIFFLGVDFPLKSSAWTRPAVYSNACAALASPCSTCRSRVDSRAALPRLHWRPMLPHRQQTAEPRTPTRSSMQQRRRITATRSRCIRSRRVLSGGRGRGSRATSVATRSPEQISAKSKRRPRGEFVC